MATIITYLSIDDLIFHLLQQLLCTCLEAEPKAFSALLLCDICMHMYMCVVIGSRYDPAPAVHLQPLHGIIDGIHRGSKINAILCDYSNSVVSISVLYP